MLLCFAAILQKYVCNIIEKCNLTNKSIGFAELSPYSAGHGYQAQQQAQQQQQQITQTIPNYQTTNQSAAGKYPPVGPSAFSTYPPHYPHQQKPPVVESYPQNYPRQPVQQRRQQQPGNNHNHH